MTRWWWLPLLWSACWSSPAVSVVAPPVSAVERLPATAPVAESELRVEERWIGGAVPGSDVPVIVAVHGLGDDPVRFSWLMDGWPTPARLILPEAPTPFGDGFAWMTVRSSDHQPDRLAAQLDASAARVAALCREVSAKGRKPVLIGFSQGGMIAWTVAMRHPDAIVGAVPLAGFLPDRLLPEAGGAFPAVRALHGTMDRVVPMDRDLSSVHSAQALGVDATLEAFPGAGHEVPQAMRQALFREIAALQAL